MADMQRNPQRRFQQEIPRHRPPAMRGTGHQVPVDEQEGAGRRAVETVLLRYGYLEFRGTMTTNFQAAGRKG